MKKWIHRLLPILMLGFLLLGLVRTLFLPKDINYYENRTANKAPELTLATFRTSTFQNGMEDALNDQIPLAQFMKSRYNQADATLLSSLLWGNLEHFPRQYIKFKSVLLFHDGGEVYATYPPKVLDDLTERLDEKAANYNACISAHPELEFYLYFIEKDTDINFATGEKLGAYVYFSGQLDLPAENMACFSVDSFDAYSQTFFQTDHHWNYRGAYEGYCQVMNLLGKTEEILVPTGEVTLPNPFSGSKTTYILGSASVIEESLTVHRFDFPPMDITINAEAVADYGNREQFLSLKNPAAPVAYGAYYGGDEGQVIFNTGDTQKENILILGESFDNAILKLMAPGFGQLHSIDLRNYARQNGESFRLASYVEKYGITKVLFIGNLDCFISSDFLLED